MSHEKNTKRKQILVGANHEKNTKRRHNDNKCEAKEECEEEGHGIKYKPR